MTKHEDSRLTSVYEQHRANVLVGDQNRRRRADPHSAERRVFPADRRHRAIRSLNRGWWPVPGPDRARPGPGRDRAARSALRRLRRVRPQAARWPDAAGHLAASAKATAALRRRPALAGVAGRLRWSALTGVAGPRGPGADRPARGWLPGGRPALVGAGPPPRPSACEFVPRARAAVRWRAGARRLPAG